MNINVIVATCKNGGIGFKNTLPFHFKKDLQYFSKITKGSKKNSNAVLMGSKTWNSLPTKPLPHRINYILSRNMSGENVFNEIIDCIDHCKTNNFENLWVIGGQTIYNEFIFNPTYKDYVSKLYVTKIHKNYTCDTFFPIEYIDNGTDWKKIKSNVDYDNDVKLEFCIYKNNR